MKVTALPFFQHVKWQPDARELRRFAVAMLIGFGVFGLLAAWRAKGITTGAITFWTIGAGLAVAAFVPRLGRVAYLAVYLPTSIIGYVLSNVILALMFFFLITPVGIMLRLMGKDPLRLRRVKKKSDWALVKGGKSKDDYYRQF